MAKDQTKETKPDLASLKARALALRTDIDEVFDRQVEQLKRESPGVPEQVLRGLLMKNQTCRCALVAALPGES